MNNTRPSFYLISSAVDGNVNRLKRYWHCMTRTYQNVVYVHFATDMVMSA